MSSTDYSEGRLFRWYRSYIGEPDREVDVYLGFMLFFGAIGLAATAFMVFFTGQMVSSLDLFTWRKIAFSLGMAALPTALGSVIVLLPVDTRGLIGGAVGGVICLGAIVVFTQVYPYQWDAASTSYSLYVMFAYSLGMAILLASTGGALVAYHIDRARPHPAEINEPESEQQESYTDEEIQSDIEQAMENVDLTWGGVSKSDNTSLELTMEDEEIDTSGMQVQVERVKSESVDQQVDGLKAVKGGDKKTARSTSTVDDQTAQLKELRQRKENEDPESEETTLESTLDRISNVLKPGS
jgi:hypothetical protein